MIWNIQFTRKRYAYWLSPGYHSSFERLIGKTVMTKNGVQARLVNIEYNVLWKQMSRPQKNYLQDQFGDDVKHRYHRFTRVTLDKVLWEQTLLPVY